MDTSGLGKYVKFAFFSTAQTAVICLMLAVSTQANSRDLNPSLKQMRKPVVAQLTYVPRVAVPTIAISDVIDNAIDLGEMHCIELNQIIIAEGQDPIRCRDGGGLSSNWTPTETDTALPQGDSLEPVLLIHGFSNTQDHDCDVYWGEQKRLIEQEQNTGDGPPREAEIVGWYMDNTNCDVNLPDDLHTITGQLSGSFSPSDFSIHTPISDVARALRDWIFFKYTINGRSVDIVAHSLGGIVVRKMLDEWGDELLVSDVITLGTPHGGVNSAVTMLCFSEEQCKKVNEGSEFIDDLEHNPQGAMGTQWTLVSADNDQIVGQGTGIDMDDGNGPSLIKKEYKLHHRHGCSYIFGAFSSIGHQDLIGDIASLPVYECDWLGRVVDEEKSPTELILDAIRI